MAHLQEDGCMYMYAIVRNFSMQNVPYYNCIYNGLPEDKPSGSKHVGDIKINNQNISSRNDQKYALIVPLLYSIYWLLHVSAVACHHQGAS
jgi:hypothetical protein